MIVDKLLDVRICTRQSPLLVMGLQYGEITPHSFLGRLVTLPLLLFGLLLIALPSSGMNSAFYGLKPSQIVTGSWDEASLYASWTGVSS
jgi:hypothetical protein